MTRTVAWDTETFLIRPSRQFPEMVCLTSAEGGTAPQLLHVRESEATLRSWLEDPAVVLVGHNLAFDAGVICAAYPGLVSLVFAAYDAGRMACTMIREQLLDIAQGQYRYSRDAEGVKHARGYSLDDCNYRYRGFRLDKDTWRLRYGELVGLPCEAWPEGAQTYPKEDAVATLAVYEGQEITRRKFGVDLLENAAEMTRRDFAAKLCSGWGLHTYGPAVEKLRVETEQARAIVEAELVFHGLVRADGSRDTKAAARYMVDACAARGLQVPRTKGAKAKLAAGAVLDDLEGIALDEDSCLETEDPLLRCYSEFTKLGTVLSKDVPLLLKGTDTPIHARFSILETGRTSTSPNIQNPARKGDVRSCFRPRHGRVFAQADYDQLELRTLAQSCLDLIGESRLAQVLNAGEDPHTAMAATIGGVSLEEGKALRKSKDKAFDALRQLAKAANFGFPGGLGAPAFVSFAKQSGTILSEERAKALKNEWFATWPEMRRYFGHINSLTRDGSITLKQVRSNRWRGKARYTEACNSFFQGLGADASGRAWWLLAKACYTDLSSPLFGCRVVNFIHDEFHVEVSEDLDIAEAAAGELARLMVAGANEFLPDVPARTEPLLMRFWHKDAQPVFVDGRLVPWFGNCKTVVGVAPDGKDIACGKPLVMTAPGHAVCQGKTPHEHAVAMPWL